ncbi:MAG: PadR family transcriptional regulator [Sciscionella sp.]
MDHSPFAAHLRGFREYGSRERGGREHRAAREQREPFDPRLGHVDPPFPFGAFAPPGADMGGGVPPFPPFPPGSPGQWPGGTPGFPPGWGPGDGGRARGRQHGRGHGRGHRPGGRQRRGDVRSAILALLAERSMHGYEMIKEITERSGGFWRPSPGSVYPTLQLLTDEGLIVSNEGTSSKRLFELTDDGRAAMENQDDTPPWEQVTLDLDPNEISLRTAMGQLSAAMVQVARAATSGQRARAVEVVNEAKRKLYAILGEDAEKSYPDTDDSESEED